MESRRYPTDLSEDEWRGRRGRAGPAKLGGPDPGVLPPEVANRCAGDGGFAARMAAALEERGLDPDLFVETPSGR